MRLDAAESDGPMKRFEFQLVGYIDFVDRESAEPWIIQSPDSGGRRFADSNRSCRGSFFNFCRLHYLRPKRSRVARIEATAELARSVG